MLLLNCVLVAAAWNSWFLSQTLANENIDQPAVWPLPAQSSVTGDSVEVDGSFQFIYSKDYGTVVEGAVKRYSSLIAVPSNAQGALSNCTLKISETTVRSNKSKVSGSDESYSVNISEDGYCSISANTQWGILRGMETFSQLLTRTTDNAVVLTTNSVQIVDAPRFAHRGILIDTARHFLSVQTIKNVIDTLPTNKFNVLHWHVVDAESFPLDTPSESTMVNGAFSTTMTYSMEQIRELTIYAYERGVDLIFEVDVPGHAAGWINGKPEVMAKCFQKYSYNINDFALNPTLEETYVTLENILGDIVNATGVSTLHIGGDEVVYGCWAEDASITSFMTENSIGSYDELLDYFVQRADSIVKDVGANRVIHWEEVFKAGCTVSKENAFQVWTDDTMVDKITAAGYSVIASPSNYWYLDISSNTWEVMYSYNPTSNLTVEDQATLVIGGEAALWGEYIDDFNILQNIYPRAAAVGERLWSPLELTPTTESDEALSRLLQQRCRLVNRGVPSAPVEPAGYCSAVYV